MKRLLAFIVVTTFVAMIYGQQPGDPPEKRSVERRAGPPNAPFRQKWEYSVLHLRQVQERGDGDVQVGMNTLGDEGWELVTVRALDPQSKKGKSSNDEYYFKRATSPALMGGGMGGGAAGEFGGARGGFGGGIGFGKKGGFGKSGGRGERGPAMEPQQRPSTGGPSRPEGPAKPVHQVTFALTHASSTQLANEFRQFFNQTSVRMIADRRTNVLIVSGTDDQVRAIRELVEVLDKPVPVKSN